MDFILSVRRIIPLLFADDLLIFCKGDAKSVSLIQELLSKFSAASRLEANYDNSGIYVACLSDKNATRLNNIMGMLHENMPFRYLDVPVSHKKLTYS